MSIASATGPFQEVLLVGFGAVGAIYSLILKKSGLVHVTAVARSNYDIVNNEGMTFQSRKYGEIKGWKPDRLCKSVAEAADRQYSYVVVATKAIPELIRTDKILEPLLSVPYTQNFAQPTYVLLQNGLNVEVDLYLALKGIGNDHPRILSAAVWILTNTLSPGNIVEHGDYDRVALGAYRYKDYTTTVNTPEESELLQDFGNILGTGGCDISIVPEVQRMKFLKNCWNVAFSSFATLTRYTIPAIFRPPPTDSSTLYSPYVSPTTADLISTFTIPTIKAILIELLTLGRALGFPDTPDGLPSSSVVAVLDNAQLSYSKASSAHVPSMLLDAENNQPIEVEGILGEVVRMAKEFNVDIPRIETLYALLIVVQNQILSKLESRRATSS